MNLPNKLTIIRVCLIPFFVAALLFDHGNNYTMRIVIIIISREFIISGFRLVAADNGVVIAASYWGKFKTTFQMAAVILMIFNIPALTLVTNIVVVIAVALTIISLVDYVAKNIKILTEGGM